MGELVFFMFIILGYIWTISPRAIRCREVGGRNIY